MDSRSRLNRSTSPKRKHKSIDLLCLHSPNSGIKMRSKMGTSFQSLKHTLTPTSTADKFIKRKDKENAATFLKKKKLAYNYLKS